MQYADYTTKNAYIQKAPGAGIRVAIYKDGETQPLIASTTGINARDDFEGVPIEEAGEDGVNEIVVGRHTGSGTVQLFWTPERNDKLPTRQNFLSEGNGVKYTIVEFTGDRRVGTDDATGDAITLNAYTGVVITSMSHQVGARGVVGADLSFLFERRYSGQEWATKNGL